MRLYSQSAATFALLLFSVSLLSLLFSVSLLSLSPFGGTGEQMSRPTSLEARASETRQARIRQLMLESEEGEEDGGDPEKMDGEDEQQGGIEAVTWGPGWGPEMDKAFGSQPIDEKNYDVLQPSGDGKAALSQMDSQIEQAEKQVAGINKEAEESLETEERKARHFKTLTGQKRRKGQRAR